MNRINRLMRRGKFVSSLLLKGNILELIRISSNVLKNGFNPLVDVDQLKPQFIKSLRYLKEIVPEDEEFGDYLEFGVSHGTSMLCMYQVLTELNLDTVRLFGFDSFEGLPKEADDEGQWKKGDFAANVDDVKKYLSKNGIDWNRVVLEKGWFNETLTPTFKEKNNIKKASIIMVDCDIYYSTVDVLKFCEDIIGDHAVLIFDDWESKAEQRAFDEFLKRNARFKIEEFGKYSYRGKPAGKIFAIHTKL
jgi:hypothetical protein